MPAPLVLPAPSPPAPTTTQGSTFRDLILDTILAVTNSYSTVPVLLWDLSSLTCESA